MTCWLIPGPVSAKLICQSSPLDSSETVRSASRFHGAHGVLAEIPEDLLEFVSVRRSPGFFHSVFSLDAYASTLRSQTMFEQGQRVFEKGKQIHLGEAVLASARIGEKIGNDGVEALRLPGHNLQQLSMLIPQMWDF